MSYDTSDGDPEGKISEEHVGKPVLTSETMIIGVASEVSGNGYIIEKEGGADLDQLSMGLLDSGDGQLAALPGQIEKITEDGIYLK